jgi:hypothetical protein
MYIYIYIYIAQSESVPARSDLVARVAQSVQSAPSRTDSASSRISHQVRTQLYIHTCIYIYMHTFSFFAHFPLGAYAVIHTYTYIYIHISKSVSEQYVHVYIYIHIYIHTCYPIFSRQVRMHIYIHTSRNMYAQHA